MQPAVVDPLLPADGGGESIAFQGIRLSEFGHLDSQRISSVGIENLCRLPDTVDEIAGIAASLGSDGRRELIVERRTSDIERE